MDDWKAKEMARASAAHALQCAFPHLIPVSAKVDRLQAAAKNIRIELKAAFPKVKFSVKSSRFSMGDSINVSWIDGPNSSQVDEIIGRYSGGRFDGMTDCYEYNKDVWLDAFGSGKYVHSRREFSDRAIASAMRTIVNLYGVGAAICGVEDYRKGKCRGVILSNGGSNDLEALVNRVLYSRTWALTQRTQRAAMPELAGA